MAFVACTNARLFGDNTPNDPDKTKVIGSVCTSDPADRQFPVRVLLLIDTTVAEGDYAAQRGDSIEKILRTFSGPNYSYGIIRYGGPLPGTTCGFRNLTPDGFTKDLQDAIASVRCADTSNPGRDINGALSLANSMISGDVIQTPLGRRSRTKYVVILFSNGRPSISLAQQWCRSRSPPVPDDECTGTYFDQFCRGVEPPVMDCERYQYTRVVRGMRDFALENGAQEFFFHAVYQRDDIASMAGMDDQVAVDLFAELSLHGGGSLFRFPTSGFCDVTSGDSSGCLFSPVNLDSTEAVFQRKQLIVSNRSALATGRGLLPDTDQDGLDDEFERMIGTSPQHFDTDGDFLSDRIEHELRAVNLDPLRNELTDVNGNWPIECPLPGSGNPTAFPPDQDLDGDGLVDCEEVLIRANPTLFDSDADGVPDPLEARYGTNPISADILEDRDADGLANLDEYRFHLAPLARDPNTDKSYRYLITREEITQVNSFTQPFGVTGVVVKGTSVDTRPGRGTIYYEPPPDPSQPPSPENPARLSWRDPQDMTPNGADVGRGPEISVVGDGTYVLHSGESDPMLPDRNFALVVDVFTDQLQTEAIKNDVIIRNTTRFCLDFEVSEIQLVVTASQADSGRVGVNFIDVFLAEVPQNNPTGFGVFRVATSIATLPARESERYPQPDIVLTDEDFLLFGD